MFFKTNYAAVSSKVSDYENFRVYVVFEPYKQYESLGPISICLRRLKRIVEESYKEYPLIYNRIDLGEINEV